MRNAKNNTLTKNTSCTKKWKPCSSIETTVSYLLINGIAQEDEIHIKQAKTYAIPERFCRKSSRFLAPRLDFRPAFRYAERRGNEQEMLSCR